MIFSLYLRIPTSCETSWRIRDTRQGAISRSGVAAWGSNFFSKSLGDTQCHQVNGRNEMTFLDISWHFLTFLDILLYSVYSVYSREKSWVFRVKMVDAPSDKRFYNVSNIRNRLQFDKFERQSSLLVSTLAPLGLHFGSRLDLSSGHRPLQKALVAGVPVQWPDLMNSCCFDTWGKRCESIQMI